MLTIVRWFELLFAILPIKYLMKLFFFSEEFTNTVALPMIALFLGTGNATPEVPSIILERLVTSPTYGMWYPGDKLSVVSNLPPMVVFPNFSVFYEDWRQDLLKRGVNVRLSTELTYVVKRDKTGVVVKTIKRTPTSDSHNPDSAWARPEGSDGDGKEQEEAYDELVLCVLYVKTHHISFPLLIVKPYQGRYRQPNPQTDCQLPRKESLRQRQILQRHNRNPHRRRLHEKTLRELLQSRTSRIRSLRRRSNNTSRNG